MFDKWVETHWKGIPFERYADDIVCHCASEEEASRLKAALEDRFRDCGLTLHPDKTKIVYCKSSNNRQTYPEVSFDFLGYTFKPRLSKNRRGVFFVAFSPAISRKSATVMRSKIDSWPVFRSNRFDLGAIARYSRSRLQGWMHDYGKYGRAELKRVLFYLNEELIRWAKRKYKRLNSKRQAVRWLLGVRRRDSALFVHWNDT